MPQRAVEIFVLYRAPTATKVELLATGMQVRPSDNGSATPIHMALAAAAAAAAAVAVVPALVVPHLDCAASNQLRGRLYLVWLVSGKVDLGLSIDCWLALESVVETGLATVVPHPEDWRGQMDQMDRHFVVYLLASRQRRDLVVLVGLEHWPLVVVVGQ